MSIVDERVIRNLHQQLSGLTLFGMHS